MPFVEVKVAGSLSSEQKKEIVSQITKTMQEVAGKPPEATYVVLTEVPRSHWAKKGELLEQP